jgi:hypothetical protein
MIKISKKSFLVAFIIVVVASISFTIYMSINNNSDKTKYAFIIDNQKFTKAEIKDLVSFPNRRSPQQDNAKIAFNYYRDQIIAEKLGITIPDSITKSEAVVLSSSVVSDNSVQAQKWIKLLIYENSLKKFLTNGGPGVVKGYLYYFWGNQHVSSFYLSGTPPAGSDNPVNIDKDKNYALQKANYFHDALKSGKLTPDAALATISSDLNLSQGYLPNCNLSVKLGDNNLSWPVQVQIPDIVAYIKSVSQKGVSEVQTAELVNYGKKMGTYYYFVDLSQTYATGPDTVTFNNAVKASKATYYGL